MTPVFTSLLFAAGLAGWIYSKIYRHTGGNMRPVITVTAVAFLFAFLIFYTILKFLHVQ